MLPGAGCWVKGLAVATVVEAAFVGNGMEFDGQERRTAGQ